MSAASDAHEPASTTDFLREALAVRLGPAIRITEIQRRPSAYRTSFPIDEVEVRCADGQTIPMMLKSLDWCSLTEEAQLAKPSFLHDPLREVEAYQKLLMPARLGTPFCYGKFTEPASGRDWLLLERVSGRELYQVGEFDIWLEVARWLAGFHAHFALDRALLPQAERLIEYGVNSYRLWLQRALWGRNDRAARMRLEWLAERYDTVVDRLLAQPTTFLHGEFYASNVLVAQTPAGLRVCPIDWEMAACGPGLIDLAALTSGKWSDEERNALALAYRHAGKTHGLPASAPDDFQAVLDCCRLHLAVQWLGWSPDWTPPPEHRHDWLGEALRLAEKLSL